MTMKIAFTGHRPNKLGGYDPKTNKYEWFINTLHSFIKQIKETNIEFISGMALGIDQWAAEYAIHQGIPFHAYIPFEGQEKMWPESSKNTFRKILSKAASVKYICDPGYAPYKMQKRNEAMVDDCDLLIAVWDGSKGGTYNCVKYAEKIGKEICIEHITPEHR
jgi:uncharacterized phage-like protein YoqJ